MLTTKQVIEKYGITRCSLNKLVACGVLSTRRASTPKSYIYFNEAEITVLEEQTTQNALLAGMEGYIEVFVVGGTWEHYRRLGYPVWAKNVWVKIEDLPRTSQVKVPTVCEVCGKKRTTFAFSILDTRAKHDGVYMCLSCSQSRVSIEDATINLQKLGMVFLTAEHDKPYINYKDLIQYTCMQHPEVKVEAQYRNAIRNKYKCHACLLEGFGGKNHHSYKDGMYEIKTYLRGCLTNWTKESLKATDFKCVISDTQDKLHVHHLVPFNIIVAAFFSTNGVPIKSRCDQYSSVELVELAEGFLTYHDSFGLGLPMTATLHKELHSLHGHSPSPEEFYYFATAKHTELQLGEAA